MTQIQPTLDAMMDEDTEARELFGTEMEKAMDILGIESSDGMLGFHLGPL